MAKKLLFVVNEAIFFLSHRLPLAEAARRKGYDVHIATTEGTGVQKIKDLKFTHHLLPLSRSGRNPIKEIVLIISILNLFRKLQPDLVHLVTIKPVLYGGIAARLTKINGVISAISGMGFLFVERAGGLKLYLLRNMVLFLYRFAMGHPNQKVIFQNSSDANTLVTSGYVKKNKTCLIRGSGVTLENYHFVPEPSGIPVVVMASRLLSDKGVNEFVDAARILRSRSVNARFMLIGTPDPGNPESVTESLVNEWQAEGVIEYLGFQSDIANIFSKSHIITLPSYREGLPKVLIEAAACGRAVVTPDTPGCRDAIEPNVTGLLVPPRDAKALAEAINCLINDTRLRERMGKAGRSLAEREFGINKVVTAHLDIYNELAMKKNI